MKTVDPIATARGLSCIRDAGGIDGFVSECTAEILRLEAQTGKNVSEGDFAVEVVMRRLLPDYQRTLKAEIDRRLIGVDLDRLTMAGAIRMADEIRAELEKRFVEFGGLLAKRLGQQYSRAHGIA